VVHTLIFADLFGGLGINAWNFLSQLISFFIIFLILWRWLIVEARRQGQEVIERAEIAAQRVAERIQEEAQARTAQFEQQQIERIRQEAARARAEISRLVVNLSINAAGKVIGKSVDNNDNRRLVEEFVSATQIKDE